MLTLVLAVGCSTTTGSQDAGPPGPPMVTVTSPILVGAGTRVDVTAVGTQANGSGALNYRWEQITGTPVTLGGANTAVLNVSTPASKTELVFRVTVTDAALVTATADVRLLVRRPTPGTPLPLAVGRTFTYTVREQTYTWMGVPGPLNPPDPTPSGSFTMTVQSTQMVNGLPVFTLAFAETRSAAAPTCQAGMTDELACGSPNFVCQSGTCVPTKPFVARTVEVLQADDELWTWRDANTLGLTILDPDRVLPGGMPALLDGLELFSDKQRVTPQLPDTPLRFLGPLPVTVPGTMPAGSLVTNGTMTPTMEIFDGTRRTDVLSPYRTTRAHYLPGTGLVFFQAESVTSGFAPTAQSGYRDAVLTGIDPAP